MGGKRPAVLLFVLLLLFAGSMVPMVRGGIWDHYHEKDELIGMFKTLCDARSSHASYESVGKSYLGEDIWMFSIGNPYGNTALLDGLSTGALDALEASGRSPGDLDATRIGPDELLDLVEAIVDRAERPVGQSTGKPAGAGR